MMAKMKKMENLSKKNIIVVGDLMIDQFIYGSVSRISPEAPVPVVETLEEKTEPGGAGNVANNIVSLNAGCRIVGIVGADFEGEKLRAALNSKAINTDGVFIDSSRPTIQKTRIIAGHQQVVRVDREKKGRVSHDLLKNIRDYILEHIEKTDGVIISDYGKGVISRDLLREIIAICRKYRRVVTVDPKIEHFKRYRNVTCITPNTAEALGGMGIREIKSEQEMINLGFKILKSLQSESLLITRGEKGMTLFLPNGKFHNIPTMAKEVYDVTGAGDTVIAVFTLSLTLGLNFIQAAKVSNAAAGIVVGKLGTTPIQYAELMKALKSIDF